MAMPSVNDLLRIINQEIESREILSEHLSKAEALAHITISNDFLNYPVVILYYYLLVLSDVIEDARKLNELSLNSLLTGC